MTNGPLIVQSDKTLLLDIDHPDSVECRRAIAPFAELERSILKAYDEYNKRTPTPPIST